MYYHNCLLYSLWLHSTGKRNPKKTVLKNWHLHTELLSLRILVPAAA